MLTDLSGYGDALNGGAGPVELMGGMTLRKLRKMTKAQRRKWWKGLPKWKRVLLIAAMPPILPLVAAGAAAAAAVAPVAAVPALAVVAIAKRVKKSRAKRAAKRKVRVAAAAKVRRQARAAVAQAMPGAVTEPAEAPKLKIPAWLPLVGVAAMLIL